MKLKYCLDRQSTLIPIYISDKKHGRQRVTANVKMSVNLSKHQRGTHMSRFVQVIDKYREATFNNEYITKFLVDIRAAQEANSARIEIDFIYFIDKKSPISGRNGIMSYKCKIEGSSESGKKAQTFLTVKVPISSVCPCSLAISDVGAYNQRGEVLLKIQTDKFIWLEDLIFLVEKNACCEIYSLLKRTDEKYVTEKMFNNPKFVEDIVRDMVLVLKRDKRVNYFQVRCENFESIHNHNAYAQRTYFQSNQEVFL